jgi:hypothetical protein
MGPLADQEGACVLVKLIAPARHSRMLLQTLHAIIGNLRVVGWRIEPARVCQRLFGLNHSAMGRALLAWHSSVPRLRSAGTFRWAPGASPRPCGRRTVMITGRRPHPQCRLPHGRPPASQTTHANNKPHLGRRSRGRSRTCCTTRGGGVRPWAISAPSTSKRMPRQLRVASTKLAAAHGVGRARHEIA